MGMPFLEIRISRELADAGLLGLLTGLTLFPSEPPEAITVLEEEGADAWGQPGIRAALVAAIASHRSMQTLTTGLLPVSNLQGLMDFYAALNRPLDFFGPPPQVEPGRFFPLRWVTSVAELDGLSLEIAAVLTDDADARRYLKYLVAELLENALHHAEWERGALVGAQMVPATERAQLAIVDCGIGIRGHLSRSPALSVSSDAEALSLALRPWVTGTAGQSRLDRAEHGHVGCGLPVAAGLVAAAGGSMCLASGTASVRARAEGHQTSTIHSWRGTLVVIDVWRPGLRDFHRVLERVRNSLGPRPKTRPLRFS